MEIRLYLDEDSMSRGLLKALRSRGVDVHSALEAGMVDRSDAEHLELATRQGRVLFSFNIGDYYRLHTQYLNAGQSHGGVVIYTQQHYSVGEVMRRLLATRTEVRSRYQRHGWRGAVASDLLPAPKLAAVLPLTFQIAAGLTPIHFSARAHLPCRRALPGSKTGGSTTTCVVPTARSVIGHRQSLPV